MGNVPTPSRLGRLAQTVAVSGLAQVTGPLASVVAQALRLEEERVRATGRYVRCEYCGVSVLAHRGTCTQCGGPLPDPELQRLVQRAAPEIRPDPATMLTVQR